MAQEKQSRLEEWAGIVRAQIPVVRERFDTWVAGVAEDPSLLWQTATVRYTVYVFGAVILFWAVSGVAHMVTPPLPANARPEATTADFHVICANPECGHHFVIHRDFAFDQFPVACPKCKRATGMQARRCNSPTCRGRWVPPESRDGHSYCPVCGAEFE